MGGVYLLSWLSSQAAGQLAYAHMAKTVTQYCTLTHYSGQSKQTTLNSWWGWVLFAVFEMHIDRHLAFYLDIWQVCSGCIPL